MHHILARFSHSECYSKLHTPLRQQSKCPSLSTSAFKQTRCLVKLKNMFSVVPSLEDLKKCLTSRFCTRVSKCLQVNVLTDAGSPRPRETSWTNRIKQDVHMQCKIITAQLSELQQANNKEDESPAVFFTRNTEYTHGCTRRSQSLSNTPLCSHSKVTLSEQISQTQHLKQYINKTHKLSDRTTFIYAPVYTLWVVIYSIYIGMMHVYVLNVHVCCVLCLLVRWVKNL